MSAAHLSIIRGGQPVPKAPRKQAPPPIRPRPEPGRYPFCKGLPADVIEHLRDLALFKRGVTGEPLTWDEAVVDYMVETDGGRAEVFTLEERAERWGWSVSKSTMSERLKAIREDAADWAQMYSAKRREARSADRKPAEHQPNATERQPNENPPQTAETQPEPNTTERQPNAAERGLSHIYARDITHNPEGDDDEGDARARGKLDPGERLDPEVGLDELTDSALRYRSQIEALLGSSDEARLAYGYRALKAGQMPQADVVRMLAGYEVRGGPIAVTAALVLTANEAGSHFHPQRLSFFESTIDNLLDHVTRSRIGTDPVGNGEGFRQLAPGAHAGDAGGAGGQVPAARRAPGGSHCDPGADPRQRPGRNGGVPGADARGDAGSYERIPEHRRSASDRASGYGFDDAHRDVEAAFAQFGQGAPDDGGGDDA